MEAKLEFVGVLCTTRLTEGPRLLLSPGLHPVVINTKVSINEERVLGGRYISLIEMDF